MSAALDDAIRTALRDVLREELTALLAALYSPAANEPYVNLTAAARQLGVSRPSLAKLLAAGAPSIGAGRLRRIRPTDVAAWLAARSGASPDAPSVDELLARRQRRGQP